MAAVNGFRLPAASRRGGRRGNVGGGRSPADNTIRAAVLERGRATNEASLRNRANAIANPIAAEIRN